MVIAKPLCEKCLECPSHVLGSLFSIYVKKEDDKAAARGVAINPLMSGTG